MSIHQERAFEDGICAHLAGAGWLYEPEAAARYDRTLALFPEDLIAWVEVTQPKAWEALAATHGAQAAATLATRLRDALDRQGTLAVLRGGFEVVGLRQTVATCQFRPAFGINPDIQARYAANRLRVVRQVRYATANENSIDLVLFLNGIATSGMASKAALMPRSPACRARSVAPAASATGSA